jgi:hypothetical protein
LSIDKIDVSKLERCLVGHLTESATTKRQIKRISTRQTSYRGFSKKKEKKKKEASPIL